MELLKKTVGEIRPLDKAAMESARNRIDSLIKPQGSLGKLEELSVQLCGITSKMHPEIGKKAVLVMAADNGVCEEGVASAPQIVTTVQASNIADGITGVGPIATQGGAEMVVVDVGMAVPTKNPKVLSKSIMNGTSNMAKMPAMTRYQAVSAIEIGIETANDQIGKGVGAIATGEMGIGNTTTSTAVLSVMAGIDPYEITGIGANLPLEKVKGKAYTIKKAIELNRPDRNDPLDVLSKVGGLDIAAMAGIMLACAAKRIPVIIDGYISTVAAIIASEIEPLVKGYMVPSHSSFEKGAAAASRYLGLSPMLNMELRLGEGSGAAMMFNIMECAIAINRDMITFEEGGIDVV